MRKTPPLGAALAAVAGDSVRPPGASSGPLLVEHCRVEGRMAERTGIDGKPYHIGFELRLPKAWNGRLLYQGGGGNDGVVRPAVGAQAAPGYALNRGFAVVSTDAGHLRYSESASAASRSGCDAASLSGIIQPKRES